MENAMQCKALQCGVFIICMWETGNELYEQLKIKSNEKNALNS